MKGRSSSRLANTLKVSSPPMQMKPDKKKKRTTSKALDDGYSTGNESEVGSVDDYVADEAFFDSNEFLPRKRVASMKTIKALRDVQKQKKVVDEGEVVEVDDEEEEEDSQDEEESEDEGMEKRKSKGRSQRRKRDTQGKEKSQKQRNKEVYDALEQKRRYFAMIDKHELVIEKM